MLEYKESPGRFSHGNDAFLGKWKVGWVGWNRITANDPPYAASCLLPGIKNNLGRFETEADARGRLEKAVKTWLSGAGLIISEGR